MSRSGNVYNSMLVGECVYIKSLVYIFALVRISVDSEKQLSEKARSVNTGGAFEPGSPLLQSKSDDLDRSAMGPDFH